MQNQLQKNREKNAKLYLKNGGEAKGYTPYMKKQGEFKTYKAYDTEYKPMPEGFCELKTPVVRIRFEQQDVKQNTGLRRVFELVKKATLKLWEKWKRK